jgi:hypothetical protein
MVEELDDKTGMSYEHVLGRAVHRCLAEGGQWSPLPCSPGIVGISGTCNVAYPTSMFSRARRGLFHRVKSWALAR